MRCPKCGSLDDKVIDSRMAKDGASIRRRRVCLDCGTRFTTYEEIERAEIRVVKRDGRTEPFERQKLLGSFEKACEKRPISSHRIEQLVNEIQLDLESLAENEVPSQEIGRQVMDKLRATDPVAYVRYASVYREFQEIGDFIEEIETMERHTRLAENHPELFKA
jgi:transcriptional repressor NrdR